MILVDANLLIYAHVSSYAEHARARQWLDEQFSSGVRIGLPWPSLIAFLRVATNRRLFATAQTMQGAWKQVHAWLDQPNAWIPAPTDRHAGILESLSLSVTASAAGDLIYDMHLAALAMEHGLVICTNDRDFALFPGVRWTNPLIR